jgi:hypothetical protein
MCLARRCIVCTHPALSAVLVSGNTSGSKIDWIFCGKNFFNGEEPQYVRRSRTVNITARMDEHMLKFLYASGSLSAKIFADIVTEYAQRTPQPDDVFLHSLCVNKVSRF